MKSFLNLATIKTLVGQNYKAALTVSIVSVPLSLALAITSGATPTQGIITAFWAGLLGAVWGGSNYNVMGPTGALAGILVSYALIHGYQILPIVAILAGGLILLSYLFGLDKYIIFIPRSVIYGFTLGVAILIGLGQLDNMLGIAEIEKTESFLGNVVMVLQHLELAHWPVFFIFGLSTLFILGWNKKYPSIPGASVVAFLGIGAMLILPWLGYTPNILTLGDKYPSIHATLFENPFKGFSWELFLEKDLWMLAVFTAVIGILETLLSGQIADSMTDTKFNHKKEVLGLSIANIGSGLMGGLPATAALARTALNIKSGANHKTSAIMNALFVGLIAIFFITFFKFLPMVIVASILSVIAIGMVEKKHFIRLLENEKQAFVLSLFVALVVVVEDPIIGILMGTIVALLIFVNKLSYGQTEVLLWKNGKMTEALLKNDFLKRSVIDSDIVVYKISGTLTYVNMPAHLKAAQKIKHNNYVIISLRHSFYADIDGVEYLGEIIELLKKNKNKHILLTGINQEIQTLIHKEAFYQQKLVEGKIYTRTSEAIEAIHKQ